MRESESSADFPPDSKIEVFHSPTSTEEIESQLVAGFYRQPENYESALFSEKVDYKLAGFLQSSFYNLGIKSGRVLDLGCGPGIVADAIRALPEGDFRLDGVDISKEMLEYALREKNYDKGYLGRIEDVVPVIAQRGMLYDYSVALSSIYYLRNPLPVIKRLFEINQKGFAISLDEITDDYIKRIHEYTGEKVPLFNHVGLLNDLQLPDGWRIADQIYGPAWRSPRVEDEINAELVTLIRDQ